MTIASLFRHELVVEHPATGTPDSWGHVDPAPYVDGATVMGLVQERRGRQIEGPDLGGVVVGATVIFLPTGTTVDENDRIRRTDSGARYEVQFVRDAAGQAHHIEIEARAIRVGQSPVGS